jgi:hypothetical protein
VASGAAVFIHAPAYASPTQFHKEYPVGICSGSLDSGCIVSALERFAEDESLRQSAAVARKDALDRVLGLPVMLRQFSAFSGIKLEANV